MRVLLGLMMLGVVVAPSRWAAAEPLILCCHDNGECRVTADADCKKVGGEVLAADFRLKTDRSTEDIPLRVLIALGIFAALATLAYCVRAWLDYLADQEKAKARSLEAAGEFLKSVLPEGRGTDVEHAFPALARQLSALSDNVQAGIGEVIRELANVARQTEQKPRA